MNRRRQGWQDPKTFGELIARTTKRKALPWVWLTRGLETTAGPSLCRDGYGHNIGRCLLVITPGGLLLAFLCTGVPQRNATVAEI